MNTSILTWAAISLSMVASPLLAPCLGNAQDAAAPVEVAPPASAPALAESAPVKPVVREAPQIEEARGRIKRAEVLFDNNNFDAALTEFEKAYQLLQGHPLQAEMLYNIALCHERSFRYSIAMQTYARYMQEAGATGAARAEVEATVRTLSRLLGSVEIRSNVPAEVWIDNSLVGSAPGTVLVPGGLHTLELRAAGHQSEQKEIRLAAHETLQLDFKLSKVGTGLSPVWFYSSLGATLASAVVGVAYAGKLKSSHDSFASSGPDQSLNRPSDEDHLNDLALRADVFFAVSGALAIGATVIGLFTDFGQAEEPKPAAQSKRGVRLARGGMGLEGWF